jgi:hypothetical protein
MVVHVSNKCRSKAMLFFICSLFPFSAFFCFSSYHSMPLPLPRLLLPLVLVTFLALQLTTASNSLLKTGPHTILFDDFESASSVSRHWVECASALTKSSAAFTLQPITIPRIGANDSLINSMLVAGTKAKRYGRFRKLRKPFKILDETRQPDMPFVVQFDARLPPDINCGGGYLKLAATNLTSWNFTIAGESTWWLKRVPLAIMFGPDMCGKSISHVCTPTATTALHCTATTMLMHNLVPLLAVWLGSVRCAIVQTNHRQLGGMASDRCTRVAKVHSTWRHQSLLPCNPL